MKNEECKCEITKWKSKGVLANGLNINVNNEHECKRGKSVMKKKKKNRKKKKSKHKEIIIHIIEEESQKKKKSIKKKIQEKKFMTDWLNQLGW